MENPFERHDNFDAPRVVAASGIIELANKPKEEYTPPVGPGSKSLPPTGDFRQLPPGLIPNFPRRK